MLAEGSGSPVAIDELIDESLRAVCTDSEIELVFAVLLPRFGTGGLEA